MRIFLYASGIIVAALSVALLAQAAVVNPANAINETTQFVMLTERMVALLIGVVLFVGGALVGAIERVEKVQLASMPLPSVLPPGVLPPRVGPG